MYKPLSDSTLMGMTKKEIISVLRVAEHNHKVCEEQLEQQYQNILNNFVYKPAILERIHDEFCEDCSKCNGACRLEDLKKLLD